MAGLEEKDKELADFLSSVRKLNEPRVHKVNHSLGVYDAYKYLRKNKWFNIGRPLTEHEFYSIIRRINNYLADSFLRGHDIKLPHRMGQLELRKYDVRFSIEDGKVKTNLPIDWDRTLKLWYEDEEAYKERTLVKVEEKEIYKVYYNKQLADYQNMVFYEFKVNRELKKSIKQRIKNGLLDAFKFRERNGKGT